MSLGVGAEDDVELAVVEDKVAVSLHDGPLHIFAGSACSEYLFLNRKLMY